jgi:hypothetical protein
MSILGYSDPLTVLSVDLFEFYSAGGVQESIIFGEEFADLTEIVNTMVNDYTVN